MDADGQRQQILDTARECAKLTKPWALTKQGQQASEPLSKTFQNMGADGVTNIVGRVHAAVFPSEIPWLRYDLSPELRYGGSFADEQLQAIEQALFTHEMLVMAMIESCGMARADEYGNRHINSFRTSQINAINQVVITGETLEYMDDDFGITVYRRDQYVTKRDSTCAVQYHGIRETIDPLSLTDEQLAKAELRYDELKEKDVGDREKDIFTFVDWQPRSRSWLITQEVNDRIINETEEKITPYFSVPYELIPGENYARGFIEQKSPDLRSLNEGKMHLLNWAALAAKAHPVLDYSSLAQEEDLLKESGKPWRGRVENGMVMDVGFFHLGGKLNDVGFLAQFVAQIESRLGASMLIGSESVRKSERTTAFEVARITLEQLQGALGGFYTPMADALQIPLAHRSKHILEKRNLLPSLPKGAIRVRTLTGTAALERESQASAMLDLAQVAQMLGPEALRKIDTAVFVDVYARLRGVNEPALIKTNEQLAREAQEAQAQFAQQEATKAAMSVAGNVAQQAIAPQQLG